MITTGQNVRSHVIRGWWKDTGRVEDLLEANRIVLADLERRIEGTVDAATVIEGARITDAYIGPFTALADGVRLERCEIEHSIVLDRSEIRDLDSRIESSLIGRDVVVTASDARPRAHRLMLGDSSRVELS